MLLQVVLSGADSPNLLAGRSGGNSTRQCQYCSAQNTRSLPGNTAHGVSAWTGGAVVAISLLATIWSPLQAVLCSVPSISV